MWVFAALAVAGALGTARALRGFTGFRMTGDALLHGDLARSLAAGDGFVPGFVYPISLVFPPLVTLPQPHFLYHPGYAATLAPAIALLDARDRASRVRARGRDRGRLPRAAEPGGAGAAGGVVAVAGRRHGARGADGPRGARGRGAVAAPRLAGDGSRRATVPGPVRAAADRARRRRARAG